MQLDLYQSFSPEDRTMTQFNTGLTFHDGSQWSVRFANSYLRGQLSAYYVEARGRLNEAYEAIAKLQYDARTHLLNEQVYGIRQNLSNLWLIEYAVTIYDGPRRESPVGFTVQVQGIGF